MPRRRAGEILVAEWNALVPEARARGISVIPWTARNDTGRARRRLEWLRHQLGQTSTYTAVAPLPPAEARGRRPLPDFEEIAAPDLQFGVEIECIFPRTTSRWDASEAITAEGIACQTVSYSHVAVPHWRITTDGSLGNSGQGAEVVSPILRGQDGLREVHKVCSILTRIGAKIRLSCGLHVHVNARGLPVQAFKNLVNLYARNERLIDSFMAPSRRGSSNPYCTPVRIRTEDLDRATTIEGVARACSQNTGRDGTRYRKLSIQSYWQHGTVEFRQHQGTVEPSKALAWTRFCLYAVYAAQTWADCPAARTSLEDLFQMLEIPAADREYFTGRRDHFASLETRRRAA